ncbi:MAG: hypothetical protein ABSF26_19490 [Thermoguttaceae bacterium]
MRWQSPRRTLCRVGWLLVWLAVAGGCQHTATVTGKVRYRDRPVVYGSVIFRNSDNTARSGVIEPDGSYRVENVPAGCVQIVVISRDPAKGHRGLGGPKPARPGPQAAPGQDTATGQWFPLPPKYEKPETSGLVHTIGTGQVSHDIDLQ